MSLNINDKNAHPRDAFIEFDAGPHKYTCNGEEGYLSVTTWLHSHFKPFDADAVIAKMKLSNPKCKYYGQTPEKIKAMWDKNRDEAAAAGTAMHAAIEGYFLGLGLGGAPPGPPLREGRTQGAEAMDRFPPDASDLGGQPPRPPLRTHPVFHRHPPPPLASALPVMGGVGGHPPTQFDDFVRSHPHLQPYRVEWMIFDEDVRLAGSIDFVALNPDGTLTIYDWKRCKEIKKTNSFGDFAMTECISHLPDTNYWHYALQLNTYKTILERKYEQQVSAMFLVGLHPNFPSYQIHKVPLLLQEMSDLFALRSR
jgi:hypothetical protein